MKILNKQTLFKKQKTKKKYFHDVLCAFLAPLRHLLYWAITIFDQQGVTFWYSVIFAWYVEGIAPKTKDIMSMNWKSQEL